jgi:hypothetical protein
MSKEEECNPSTREMHRGNTKRRKLKKRNKNLSPRPDVKKKHRTYSFGFIDCFSHKPDIKMSSTGIRILRSISFTKL